MPIQILAPQIASKIAAGEVVERPASVVKELIENAIDAGASELRIEVMQAGRRLIRVSDDGSGIPYLELPLAFQHHATSKISDERDLAHIRTLGFRGEALASIAAVSHVNVVTRTKSEIEGTLLQIQDGNILRHEHHGARPGTTITVENLFYNTPARLKFLRSATTESSHIIKLTSAYAMSHPEIRFTLLDDGRQVLQTSGNGKLYDVLVKVLGMEVAQRMLEIPETVVASPEATEAPTQGSTETVRVHGYVSTPELHRSTRGHQILFVNRRWIQDRALSYAVEEAFRTLLPVGRYPIAILNLAINPEDVDVNVHPTKREVRFREPRLIFSTIQRAVRHAVVGQAPVASMSSQPAAVVPTPWHNQRMPLHYDGVGSNASRTELAMELQRTDPSLSDGTSAASAPMHERLPMLRVLGQVRQLYIIAEGPDGLYLIDQHAAHERILYEQLQDEQSKGPVPVQALLEPLPLEFAPHHSQLLESQLENLRQMGFEIAPFGGNTYIVRSVPTALMQSKVGDVIAEILDAAADGMPSPSSTDPVLSIIACHGAVRAGQILSLDEARQLIHLLEQTHSPYTCPHGRPTMIHLSSAQLARSFSRQ